MKLTRILLATDFSAHSYEGLRIAEVLADQTGAELLIVHVIEPAEASEEEPLSEATRQELERRLVEMMPARTNLTVSHALLEGEISGEIDRFATHQNVDLIVMGSHGRTGVSRMLMGSVAKEVLRHSPCPVLTVRPKIHLRGDIKAWAHRPPEKHRHPTSST